MGERRSQQKNALPAPHSPRERRKAAIIIALSCKSAVYSNNNNNNIEFVISRIYL